MIAGVLDYGSGNIHSAAQALSRLGAAVVVSSDWGQINACDGLLLPGVGAFAACMAALRGGGHVSPLLDWAGAGRPLLGVCVGHQVLFAGGDEHGVASAGLGLLPGVVTRLTATRLPHMGWDVVTPPAGSKMFAGIAGERFYFVHSYAAHAGPAGTTWARHEDDTFVAAIEQGPLWGTQFHPEKSGAPGAQLLANWLAGLPERLG